MKYAELQTLKIYIHGGLVLTTFDSKEVRKVGFDDVCYLMKNNVCVMSYEMKKSRIHYLTLNECVLVGVDDEK